MEKKSPPPLGDLHLDSPVLLVDPVVVLDRAALQGEVCGAFDLALAGAHLLDEVVRRSIELIGLVEVGERVARSLGVAGRQRLDGGGLIDHAGTGDQDRDPDADVKKPAHPFGGTARLLRHRGGAERRGRIARDSPVRSSPSIPWRCSPSPFHKPAW